MGRPIKFSKSTYDLYDSPGKIVIAQHLNALGFFTLAEEDYNADIKAIHKDKLKRLIWHHHESEIKLPWKGEWPTSWKDVRIPYRKKRLLKKHPRGVTFWVCRSDRKQAWMIDSSLLKQEYVQKVRVRNPSTGRWVEDKFFVIPVKECVLTELQGQK